MPQLVDMFTAIDRQPDESSRDFVTRTWRTANPTLPENLTTIHPTSLQVEQVTEGCRAPYAFANTLREMVGGHWVAVWSTSHQDPDGLTHTIYYAWNTLSGHGTPTRAVFYDPQHRPSQGQAYLYVIEFRGSDVPSYQTTPYIPEDAIVVADTHFSVVEATASQVEQWISGFPYWKNAGHPADGKWIGAGGDAVYIANGQVVQDPLDVLRALGINNDDIAPEYYDDILETANRVF